MGEIRSTCPYCGVGCGVLLRATATGVEVRGDPDHPANRGRLCSKGAALAETVGPEGRLLAPMIGERAADWDEALDLVAARFRRTIADHGPDAVAFYVSGQCLTEDYYVANKLMKGFIGSANIDTNSRLCMASAVAGHRRAFGTDTVPGLYEDFELADVVVLVGSNMAWCHPVLFQRLMAARAARGTRVVVIDPRRTPTCDSADLHLPIAPGGDAALFNLALAEAARRGLLDRDRLRNIEGVEAALAAARATDPGLTGLGPQQLAAFFDLWLGAEKVVTAWSMGINQSDTGTDKVNAILNLHLATGRIGKPGAGPFSLTGQPNAMGGREVGGLSNMLACHLNIEDAAHRAAVRGFWAAPALAERPGLKAVDLFRAVGDGRIKALWIMCTNPVVSMPQADRVAQAIAGCDFVVVSDMMAETDTMRLAHVRLPAAGWGEKDGTVTNSERRISRQRPFRAPPGQARADWWQMAQVARRMGFAGFDWDHPAQIFAEHAALSGVAGALGSDFDISDHAGITRAGYDALAPFVWPANAHRRGGRFFADGRFHHPDGRARMIAVAPQAVAGPMILNTGRVRDHWHTMSRTGLSPRLNQHMAEPYLEVHPDDARRLGLEPDGLARVAGQGRAALLRVLVSDRVAPGQPFAPIHWTGETAAQGRIGAVVEGAADPVSGQPALKSGAVAVAPFVPAWFGYAVAARPFRPDCAYWARAAHARGMTAELAGGHIPADWEAAARRLFGLGPGLQAQVYADPSRGRTRLAFIDGGALVAALFVDRAPVAVSRAHVAALLGEPAGPALLSGRPGADRPDPGPTVCACLAVGLNTIAAAIASGACPTVAALGDSLGAGTSCGACRPELAALIARHAPLPKEAAE
ncbi:molybdopterin-dependent oxidoreductase [Ruixingdingia sedimenti]|uniref:Molybdopterin-dependent oxidoreductase n=1 Tax=Ruixingdingia sedimenti TaxID=3073604 RepID=A0ABU1F4Y9_9RHOB|nr:molybdopterin-dependent oxidoreductase [Xinfangfangia sp. LG-4]MDR5651935.1 molybdopterin-dependent oxidoreductase [Xinfangfangia sp. LG-4]